MSAEAPWVRIVIVNYETGPLLQDCVDALAAQTETSFEVVIVDNGSTDFPLAQLQLPDQRFRVVSAGRNLGFAAGSNLGANGVTAPWLATLNPDTRPRPGWLAALRAAAERYAWAVMFGSTQLKADDPSRVDGFGDAMSVFGSAWRMGRGGEASALPDRDCEPFSPCGAAALYRSSAFLDAGGFDEDFFCYLEDVDLGFRLRLEGARCVQVRDAEVLHIGGAVGGDMSDFAVFHSYRNRIWLLAKTMPWPLLICAVPLQAAGIALSLPFRRRSYRRAAMCGAWAGLKDLTGAFEKRRAVQQRRTVSAWAVARMLTWSPFRRQTRMPPPV